MKKKHFFDELRKAVSNTANASKQSALSEGAIVACVRMCKASTYIKTADSSNILLVLVKSVYRDLQVRHIMWSVIDYHVTWIE